MAEIKYSEKYSRMPWVIASGGLREHNEIISLYIRVIDIGDKEWRKILTKSPVKDLIMSR